MLKEWISASLLRMAVVFSLAVAVLLLPVSNANDTSSSAKSAIGRSLNVHPTAVGSGRGDYWVRKLIEASDLVRHSSDQAVEACSRIFDQASRSRNSAAAAVALMNRACARMQMSGMQSGLQDFRASFLMFPEDASETMHVLFLQAACRFERFSGKDRYLARIETLDSQIRRSSRTVPMEVLLRAQCEMASGILSSDMAVSWPTTSDSFLAQSSAAGANLEEPLAFLKLLSIRKGLQTGALKTPEAFQGALLELDSLSASLRTSESTIECAILKADLAQELSLFELEQISLETAIQAAMVLKCETLLTRCRLRLDTVLADATKKRIQSNCRLDVSRVVSFVNDRDLLRHVVETFAVHNHQSDSVPLESSCIQRIADLNSMIAETSNDFPTQNSARLEHLIEKQSGDLSNQAAAAERKESRSLFFAQAGFVLLCGLALILLRERWNLSRINQRLKTEIEQNERQRVEQERIELRLAQTEKLESLGAIAGGIAHDFNNLLVGVIGNADLLKQESTMSATALLYVDGIIRSAETAAELSHKMLAYAGRQASTKRVVELNSLIERMLPLFRAGSGNRHAIQFVPSEEPLLSEADNAQLEQIAMNLVTNAFQAMGDKPGSIQIRTGVSNLEVIPVDVMTIGNRKDGGQFVWFEVSDNGPGIPPHVQSRIFEPFYSTKRQAAGHGFGLSVVYGHVNRHNGLIQMYSIQGHGTTFRVLLPQCGPDEIVQPVESTPLRRAHRAVNSSDVVIVDDRRDVLDVLERTLTNASLCVHAFTSSTEALEFLLDHPKTGCVLLDIMMPEVDGVTMLQELAQKGIRIPVIIMSGFSPASPETFHDFPAVKAVVQKPFRPENMLSLVLQTIETGGENAAPFRQSAST